MAEEEAGRVNVTMSVTMSFAQALRLAHMKAGMTRAGYVRAAVEDALKKEGVWPPRVVKRKPRRPPPAADPEDRQAARMAGKSYEEDV